MPKCAVLHCASALSDQPCALDTLRLAQTLKPRPLGVARVLQGVAVVLSNVFVNA